MPLISYTRKKHAVPRAVLTTKHPQEWRVIQTAASQETSKIVLMNETTGTPFRGQAIIKINVVELPKHAGRR